MVGFDANGLFGYLLGDCNLLQSFGPI